MSIFTSRFIVPWVVAIAMLMETIDMTILSTAIPVMAQSFQISPLSLKLALTAYLISLAVFIPISGWMADKWGAARVFISALGVFTLGSLACALSQDLTALVIARFVQGIGGAMMMPVGRIVVLKTFDKSELIRATNNMIMPGLIGPALGPLLGGLIVHHLSWRWIFIVNIPIGIIGIFLAKRFMINYREENHYALDWVGFLLLGFGLISFSMLLELLANGVTAIVQIMIAAIISTILLVGYALWSKQVTHPILALYLFNIRTFAKGISGSLLSRITISAMPFLMPLLFQIGFGWSPVVSGALVSTQAIGSMLGKGMVKMLIRHLGFKRMLIVNSLIMAVMVGFFYWTTAETSKWLIAIALTLFGAAMAIQYSGVNLLCYADMPKADISKATSLNSMVQQYSGSIAIAFSAIVITIFAGGALQAQHLSSDMLTKACLAMTLFVILAVGIFVTLSDKDGSGIG